MQCSLCDKGFKLNGDGTCFYTGQLSCSEGCTNCVWDAVIGEKCTQCDLAYILNENVCMLNPPPFCLNAYYDANAKKALCLTCNYLFMVTKDKQCGELNREICTVAEGQRFDANTQECLSCSTANCNMCIWNGLLMAEQCLYCKSGFSLQADFTCLAETTATGCGSVTLYYSSSTQICLECPEFSTSCTRNANTKVVEVQTCETNY